MENMSYLKFSKDLKKAKKTEQQPKEDNNVSDCVQQGLALTKSPNQDNTIKTKHV